MALNAYQTLVNQTAAKRALSGEEQERLRQIAAQQGAAAASSAYLANQKAQQTAMPDYVAASKARSQANQAIIGGATAGQIAQAQRTPTVGEQQLAAAAARSDVMNNGTIAQQNAYREAQAKNAYQKALAAANPTTTPTAAAQPVEMKDYTWWNWMGSNDMTTMNDQDKANWNTAMQGWQNGDYSAFNDNFQTNGNWASYVDDKGNVNGMLRYVGDGVGGYVPVNNGMLLQNEGFSGDRNNYAFYGPDGSVYTADANGRLTKAGNWTMQEPYSALKDSIPYKLVKGTATDEERDKWFTQVDPSYPIRQAAANGDEEAQRQLALMAQAEATRSGITPQNPPTQNAYQRTVEQATQNTQPTVTPGSSQPAPGDTVYQGRDENAPNIYQQYMDQWDYPEAPQWEGSEYQQKRDDALKRAEDMRWSYDPNTDPVWQALQKQYRREGDRATQEALAQAAMRTGGLANSYAVTAASQAGDYYAAQLSDRLPQLYQDAYNRYLQEFQRQMGISDQYQGFDDREYSRFGDRLQQYNTDRNFDYNRYRDAVGDYRYDDETAYNRNYQAQRDAINDQRYDQEWAQQLREYADAQNWKATEWQQYLREYGDKMSQQEREWAYQQYRDAVGDERYNQAYADEQAQNAYQRELANREWDYQLSRDALEDERYDAKWAQALREYDDEQAQQAWNNEYKLSGRSSGGSGSGNGGGSGGGGKTTGGDDLGPGQYKQGGIVYRSDKTHPQGQPMSAMYEQAYNDAWDKWQRGMDYALLISEVTNLKLNKSITDYEGQMILNELRKWKEQGRMIDASKGGGMGSPRTQMTR